MELAKGARINVLVVEIEENYSSYPNSKEPEKGMMNCHKIVFATDDGAQWTGQVCSTDKAVPCMVDDMLDITVKAFTKGVYTISIDNVFPTSKTIDGPKSKTTDGRFPCVQVYGTPGEVALRHAVAHHANRVLNDPGDVIQTAEIFRNYLLAHTV